MHPSFYWCAVLLSLILNLIQSVSFAQKGTDAFELSAGVGKVIRNYPDFPELEKPAYVAAFNYLRHYNGYKPWHRYYNYPMMGISITGGAMGNSAVLGYFAGAMTMMSFEKEISSKWFWAPRLSLGSAWFSNPFDEQHNPENVIIGSEFTFLASAELAAGFRLNEHYAIIGKFTLLHASNSHFKLPNVGMNLPVLAIGARYTLTNQKEPLSDTVSLPKFNKIRFNFRVALGVNESGSSTAPVNGPKYPIYLASATVSKMFSPVNKVSAGIEAWYNKGVYDFIVSQEFYSTGRHEKSMAAAIVLGHEFLMGKWGLLTTGGIYIYNPFYKEKLKQNEIDGVKDNLKAYIPARIGVQYYFKNTNYNDHQNLFVGIYIKTNFGQADFLESGFGYVF